jgi:hypothetical protein
MPNWKKLLTSGSNIQISELTLAAAGVTKASIDTSGNLAAEGAISASGTMSADRLIITTAGVHKATIDTSGNIAAEGAISSSGDVAGRSLTLTSNGAHAASIDVSGNVAAEGYISSSALLSGTSLAIKSAGVTKASIDASGNISVAGTVDGRDLATDGTKLDGIASSANNYVLPTNLAGDDIDIDTGALTGATVISDLDLNVTTNTSGLVTDANASVATRTLTAANLSLGNVTNESKATMFTSPTFTGTLTTPLSKIGLRDLDWARNISVGDTSVAQGDVIYHAESISTTEGNIYAMSTLGIVVPADADAVATASTVLCVALGANANLGLLLRGIVVLRTSPGADPGKPIYLSTTAGQAQAAAPTETGDVVRVLGYQLTPNGEGDQVNVCYFNPDNTWVELT